MEKIIWEVIKSVGWKGRLAIAFVLGLILGFELLVLIAIANGVARLLGKD